MPPSLNEWLPEDHLVWTVLGAVEVMDLSRFNESYRLGGAGRAPDDPQNAGWPFCSTRMRAGNQRSRGIERACHEDVAFKVITKPCASCTISIAGGVPPTGRESTSGVIDDDFVGLCREAGLVSVLVITFNGKKIKENARVQPRNPEPHLQA